MKYRVVERECREERESEKRERERRGESCELAMLKQQLGTPSRCPTWVAGAQALGLFVTAFPAGSKVEEQGF